MNANCLNCANPVQHNFCPHCGQKASTHRYSLSHFVVHDFVHSVWHVDKGILFTVKELFTRPGHSVREYIQGKRVNYFSFITLILLLLAIASFINPYTKVTLSDLMSANSRNMMNAIEKFTTSYPRTTMLITLPIYAFFSFIWFRRSKLNYSEHLVLESYKIIPQLIIGLLYSVLCVFYTNTVVLFTIYFGVIYVFGIIYSTWFYYQFFSGYNYSKKQLIFRSVMVQFTFVGLSFLIGIILGILKLVGLMH